ncbi:hypothetical protein P7C71_g167, partial [Lecanoromycetidae sp. Uapishka_2]
MLITESHHDVPTNADGKGSMRTIAAPSSYHEFTSYEPLAYDGPGTDAGNEYKVKKKLNAYDEDASLSVTTLLELPTCNGRIFGKKDSHVPPEGRDLIRKTLHEKGVCFSFYEVAHAQHAFIRDELSKGRYDPVISKICFEMLLELFGRTLKSDLGPQDGGDLRIEDVC